jgi:hypothetical protein
MFLAAACPVGAARNCKQTYLLLSEYWYRLYSLEDTSEESIQKPRIDTVLSFAMATVSSLATG